MVVSVNSAFSGVDEKHIQDYSDKVMAAHKSLHGKTGAGSDFLGWLDLPVCYDKQEYARIKDCAAKIREQSDILIVVGIGGSYLGARAVIEALGSQYFNEFASTKVYFAGNSISADSLGRILKICEGKRVSVNVISKSGTTTEPAVAFRVILDWMCSHYGEAEAFNRVYVTTDKARGTLKKLADSRGWPTFVVPDDVGGRYSVLTAVGLLPIAAAGFNTDKLLEGAQCAMRECANPSLEQNDCYRYAVIRNILYSKGKTTELLASYEPSFALMSEWFKQLFGESEGKENKGIFPASVIFSTDLHSMGQYIQQGLRNLFETVVSFDAPNSDITLKQSEQDFDGLNYLAGRGMSYINRQAMLGTLLAHTEGGVPNILINVPAQDEYHIGALMYFLEKACAISGYLLGVNPFDQPGVEAYKKNMFALLGKPGYEELKTELELKLKEMRSSK